VVVVVVAVAAVVVKTILLYQLAFPQFFKFTGFTFSDITT
jgi:hypothetical protein